jgi:hypothetical protein
MSAKSGWFATNPPRVISIASGVLAACGASSLALGSVEVVLTRLSFLPVICRFQHPGYGPDAAKVATSAVRLTLLIVVLLWFFTDLAFCGWSVRFMG